MLLYCWVIFAYVQGILHIWVDFVRGLLSYGGYWRGDFVLQSTKSHVGAEELGSENKSENYKPVSLTSVICKLLGKLITGHKTSLLGINY